MRKDGHQAPASHRDLKARSTGHGVDVEGDGLGPRPQGDGKPIAWNDKRFYSTDIGGPSVRVRKGADTDGDGNPIYSSDIEVDER